jgi:spore germination protein KB
MPNEVIEEKSGFLMATMFINGSALIFMEGLGAQKDIWLAVIAAMIMSVPVLFIFTKLHTLFPGKNLFDICENCFPKIIAKLMILLFTLFFFDVSIEGFMNYGYFIHTVAFNLTPLRVPVIINVILCIAALKSGIKTLGRWSGFAALILFASLLMLLMMSIPNMNPGNFRPVLSQGLAPVLQGGFEILSYPFAYMVPFLAVFTNFEKSNSPYKIYFFSMLAGGIIVMLIYATNIAVLGPEIASKLYYPTYVTASIIKIGFVQRIEILASIIFSLGGFVELSVYMLAATKGITKLFHCSDYKTLVIPIALLMVNISFFHFENIVQYFEFGVTSWPYYSFFFEGILPLVVLIFALIRKKAHPLSTVL